MEFRTAVPVIKKVMKNKKITYRILAKRLGMSESGTKKVLQANDCPIGKLNAICNAIGMPLKDLMDQADQTTIKEVSFSDKQEEFLFNNPDCFHFYWKLTVENMSFHEIEKRYRLSKQKIRKFLTALDRLNLIRLETGDKVILPESGLIRWVGNGPLLTYINKEWSKQVLEQNYRHPNTQGYLHQLKFFMLRNESIREFIFAMDQLLDEFSIRSSREKATYDPQDLKPLSLLLGMTPNSFVEKI